MRPLIEHVTRNRNTQFTYRHPMHYHRFNVSPTYWRASSLQPTVITQINFWGLKPFASKPTLSQNHIFGPHIGCAIVKSETTRIISTEPEEVRIQSKGAKGEELKAVLAMHCLNTITITTSLTFCSFRPLGSNCSTKGLCSINHFPPVASKSFCINLVILQT